MQINGVGDLAKAYSLQNRNTALKNDLQSLTLELTTGQVADIRGAVTGKTAYINDISRSLKTLDAYEFANREAGEFAGTVQRALDRVSTISTDFTATLMTGTNAGFSNAAGRIAPEAATALQSIVGALNSNIAGRAVFSGTGVDQLPLVDADTISDAVRTVVAGAGTVDDMIAAAEAWFDDPAGFATVAYRGTDSNLAPVAVSETVSAQFNIRADDPALRDTLRVIALAALADDPTLGLTDAQQAELYQKSLEPLLAAQGGVIDLQATTGFTEGQIEAERVRNGTERTSLEMARATILSKDPYDTATELEQVQFQLQSLYTMTSRMSALSLVNFL
ncbi:flagellar hook protein [Sulfitobacter albidus]|uniref:Flagellar hook protein n=1 Tax=Sulfitobacter albidus TaxID=2829501 RepID=A0A975JD66_9RHOB|nr:flagellar hook protein [Sulfitobacter albidus]QUJ76312.1 flagellar hook protein [Sulfitobacter albidus]